MILFTWSGFPQYAARCIGAFVASTTERVAVIATRPKVPIEGMEKLCGCDVHWISPDTRVDLATLFGEMPRVAIVNGWFVPAFNSVRDAVRAHGGRVYCSIDNNYAFSFREVLKAIRFRFCIRSRYDGFFVPGRSGVRLLRFYGVSQDRIKTGMYAADASLFRSTVPVGERPKRIIYVGQICERKNVCALVDAFQSLAPQFPDWSLDLYGAGPLEGEVREKCLNARIKECLNESPAVGHSIISAFKHSNISPVTLHSFAQPEELAGLYNQARVFVLPSKEEHWGVVVHEAALSGCVLLASRQVGAAEDFVREVSLPDGEAGMPPLRRCGILPHPCGATANGYIFDANSPEGMRAALKWAMTRDDRQLAEASRLSVAAAKGASVERFVASVREFCS